LTLEPVPAFIIQFVAAKIRTEERFLRPGELARLAGVSVDTLRHYERKGLLSPRRAANRYREYPEAALGRVRLVRRALSVGFGLDDLARILKERDRGGAPCRQVRQLARARLAEIDLLIEELSGVREDLRKVLEDWDSRLERVEKGQPARLLEALAAADGLQTADCRSQVESSRVKVKGSKRSPLQAAIFRRTRTQRRRT
jgi:DNA-binding transcriptional MerR regulator